VPVRRAQVRIRGRRARTNKRGRAAVRLPREPGLPFDVHARKRGFRGAIVTLGIPAK
jgi:hypothetical protein